MRKVYRIEALKLYIKEIKSDFKKEFLYKNGTLDYLNFLGVFLGLILMFPLGIFVFAFCTFEFITNVINILVSGRCTRTAYPSSIKKDYSREAYHNMKEKYKLSIGYEA